VKVKCGFLYPLPVGENHKFAPVALGVSPSLNDLEKGT
jgi:hypothetical protein